MVLDGHGMSWAFSRFFLVLTMELSSSAIAVIYQNVLPVPARLAMRNDAGAMSSKHGEEKRNMANSPGKNSENHGQLHGSRNGNVGKRWEEVIKTEHYPTCVHCTRSTQFCVLCVHLVIWMTEQTSKDPELAQWMLNQSPLQVFGGSMWPHPTSRR